MDSVEWIDLLGHTSEDAKVRAALAKVGLKRVPAVGRQDIDVQVELPDAMLTFTEVDQFPDLDDGGDGTTVLTCVFLPLKNRDQEYKGPLFLGFDRRDSRKKLRARFGKPIEFEADEDFRWDEWNVGGKLVRAEYTEDYEALEALSMTLPIPD